ncbi:PQQ-dependent sugar dehydrogenase [Runella sp. MFBS21]|uniref:PQQ-dependent sugar dehydrogenase n=1 Tax=Runella sp. MFBS21 TaxID=3034018 RepID=UPI0023F7DFD6|nr:PQQ-dependent sugar dehydrogenase [Runella sp. MFBS21]MDF7819803.1 PQQ-dependent sugar dehydrogenase [Runella sp. MFBS21]
MNSSIRIMVAVALVGTAASLTAYKSDPSATRNKPKNVDIKVPTGFSVSLLAEDLETPRHLAVSKGGDIYVKINKLKDGKAIYRLRDTNGDGVIDEKIGFGDYKGSGIFIRDGYLYASSNTGVYRYKLNDKEEVIDYNNPELIVKGLVAKGRDEAKNIAVDKNGYVYVNIGSPDEICKDPRTNKGIIPCPLLDSVGGIWRFKTNQLNQQYSDGVKYATGLKNVVGLDWNTSSNSLFVMMHGRGKFHDTFPQYYSPQDSEKLPAETMYEVHEGDDAGWPYVYYDPFQKKKILCPEYGGDGKKTGGEKAIDPVADFPAHLGPNALLFYTGKMFPAKYKNGAFIAFHGQSPVLKKGYMVAFVPFKNGKPSGKWEIFADNFAGTDLAKPTGPVQHRPCGLAQGPDGSLYVTDDLNGALFRISYKAPKK